MFLFLYKSFCLWYHAICYIISQLYAKFFGLDLVLHCVSAIWVFVQSFTKPVFTKSIKCQTNAGLWEASKLNLAHTLVVMSCSSCWADSFMLSWDTKLSCLLLLQLSILHPWNTPKSTQSTHLRYSWTWHAGVALL